MAREQTIRMEIKANISMIFHKQDIAEERITEYELTEREAVLS